MKLAVSSIAWNKDEEVAAAELLASLGVNYVEVAPTKVWDEPVRATDDEIEAYRQWWLGYGIEVVAFQSMLFTHPEYTLFENEATREATVEYLQEFTKLAGKMGAKRMVFGSPKNRQKGKLSTEHAAQIARDVFRRIGDTAKEAGVIFCIEPNAPQYNCDFVTTAKDGIEIVDTVSNDGFGLHLDTACMTLAGDVLADSIHAAGDRLKHFHISSPMLEQVEANADISHAEAYRALKEIGYDGYVSIEMKPSADVSNIERLRTAVLFAQSVYID